MLGPSRSSRRPPRSSLAASDSSTHFLGVPRPVTVPSVVFFSQFRGACTHLENAAPVCAGEQKLRFSRGHTEDLTRQRRHLPTSQFRAIDFAAE